jgi:hypothetical protein
MKKSESRKNCKRIKTEHSFNKYLLRTILCRHILGARDIEILKCTTTKQEQDAMEKEI